MTISEIRREVRTDFCQISVIIFNSFFTKNVKFLETRLQYNAEAEYKHQHVMYITKQKRIYYRPKPSW